MKFIAAALVFILALSITPKTVASEPKAEKGAHQNSQADHKEKLGQTMNSLFPQKQKDAGFSTSPAVVKLTAPKFMAKITGPSTKLEWAAVDGASGYHVQVATDPNFKWLVANDAFVKVNSFDATQLEADTKYYWRVAAVKGENDSMFTKSLFVNSVFSTQK